MEEERVKRTNSKRMLVVTTVAPPTAGERVARTNRQRMLVGLLFVSKGARNVSYLQLRLKAEVLGIDVKLTNPEEQAGQTGLCICSAPLR